MADQFSIGGMDFDDLGVISARLETAASSEGVLALQLNRPMDAAALFDPYANVELREGATLRWVGQLDIPATQVQGGDEQKQVVFKSVFQYLEKKDFIQAVYIKALTSFKDYTTVMLYRGYEVDVESGGIVQKKITGRSQIQLIADQLAAAFEIAITGIDGIPELRPPYSGKTNASLGSCLLSVLSWFPTFCVRSDFGSLEIVNTETTPLRIIDLAEIAADNKCLTPIAIFPRYDILRKSAEIIYQARDGVVITNEIRDTATRDNGSPYDTIRTYPLESGEGMPTLGLAEQYMKWAGKLKLDAEFTILGGLEWEYQPGDRIQFEAPIPSHGIDSTIIQTISRDLINETVTLRCGARNHLGLDQLIELNKKNLTPPDNDSGGEKEEEGKLRVIINGINGHQDKATWFTGDVSGAGEDTIEVTPGSYSVNFNPVFFDGRFFFAEAVTGVDVAKGQTGIATGEYEEAFLGDPKPFQGVLVDDTTIKVLPSTIGGDVPPGMGPGVDYLITAAGTGYLYAVYNYETSTGDKTSVELVQTSSEMPDDVDGVLRALLLWWSNDGEIVSVENARYGPVLVSDACPDWNSKPRTYSRAIVG